MVVVRVWCSSRGEGSGVRLRFRGKVGLQVEFKV